jgi:hypothetical protein
VQIKTFRPLQHQVPLIITRLGGTPGWYRKKLIYPVRHATGCTANGRKTDPKSITVSMKRRPQAVHFELAYRLILSKPSGTAAQQTVTTKSNLSVCRRPAPHGADIIIDAPTLALCV